MPHVGGCAFRHNISAKLSSRATSKSLSHRVSFFLNKLCEGGHPMATGQYSTLMDALKNIPDPRKRRGKRYAWLHLLTILVAGLASGYQSARAIAQWALLHADELRQHLPDVQRLPSESTILRTMRQMDGPALD